MSDGGTDAAPSAARWLSLAAAPTFAGMALLTVLGGSPADVLCTEASPLSGMAAMYALMSLFHTGPWMRLAGGARLRHKQGVRT